LPKGRSERRSLEADKVDVDIDYGSANVKVFSVARLALRDDTQRAAAAAQGID
jgi:hypothetical protein